jgi:hypothetical protein
VSHSWPLALPNSNMGASGTHTPFISTGFDSSPRKRTYGLHLTGFPPP